MINTHSAFGIVIQLPKTLTADCWLLTENLSFPTDQSTKQFQKKQIKGKKPQKFNDPLLCHSRKGVVDDRLTQSTIADRTLCSRRVSSLWLYRSTARLISKWFAFFLFSFNTFCLFISALKARTFVIFSFKTITMSEPVKRVIYNEKMYNTSSRNCR